MFLVVAALVIESLQPLRTIDVPHLDGHVEVFRYARDGQYEYLGTPYGLLRGNRIAAGTLAKISSQPVSAISADARGTLFVAFGHINFAYGAGHTLHRSLNHGATFTPIDDGLVDCSFPNDPCRYMVSSQIEIAQDRLFVEAGGNIFVTGNDGATWSQLYGLTTPDGKIGTMICPVVFTPAGQRMWLGGECPLDNGWIGTGTLRGDRLGWSAGPQRLALDLENRNVHFFRDLGDGILFAGLEGGLLKSTDGGATWRFVIHYPLFGAVRYPYPYHFLVTPRMLVVGGFDKKNVTGYLAYSTDGGNSWIDASRLVGNAHVELLAEDADGRPLIGLYDGDTFTLAEIILGERGPKRRVVRR